ncbi:hypothetical protein EIP86_009774 [Pleurotus ostreatoroseus]|nr:hypothetical protein EIP86_009774 [Pleurotus ostreatoroseus]
MHTRRNRYDTPHPELADPVPADEGEITTPRSDTMSLSPASNLTELVLLGDDVSALIAGELAERGDVASVTSPSGSIKHELPDDAESVPSPVASVKEEPADDAAMSAFLATPTSPVHSPGLTSPPAAVGEASPPSAPPADAAGGGEHPPIFSCMRKQKTRFLPGRSTSARQKGKQRASGTPPRSATTASGDYAPTVAPNPVAASSSEAREAPASASPTDPAPGALIPRKASPTGVAPGPAPAHTGTVPQNPSTTGSSDDRVPLLGLDIGCRTFSFTFPPNEMDTGRNLSASPRTLTSSCEARSGVAGDACSGTSLANDPPACASVASSPTSRDRRPYAFSSRIPGPSSETSSVISYLDLNASAPAPPPQASTSVAVHPADVDHPTVPTVPLDEIPMPTALQSSTGIAARLAAADRARPARVAPTVAAEPAVLFTPPPEGGFLDTQHAAADDIFAKQLRSQSTAWDEYAGPKCLLQVADLGALATRKWRPPLARDVHDAVSAFLGHNRARLTPPEPDAPIPPEELDHYQGPPYSFFLWGLSQGDVDRIVGRKVLASRGITIIARRFSWLTPYLFGVVRGLRNISDPDEIYDRVKPRLQACLPAILDIAAADNPDVANDPDRAAHEARIMRSLLVTFLDIKEPGGRSTPEFFVYAHIPVINVAALDAARAVLKGVDWYDPLLGRPEFGMPQAHWCLLCHGADHPRGLCPLPNTPDWLGPRHDGRRQRDDDVAPLPGPSTRGGPRGRGRGRGRGHASYDGPPHQYGSRKRPFDDYDDDRHGGRKVPRLGF